MICYKGNSFFRNIKILFKYFVEKAKISFNKNCIFYKKEPEVLLVFCTKRKKYLYEKKKIITMFFIKDNETIKQSPSPKHYTLCIFISRKQIPNLFYTMKNTEGVL